MYHEFKETDDFTEDMSFGEWLYKARRINGYSQADLADELGLYQHTISDWELAKSSPPIEKARKFMKELGFKLKIVRAEE